MNDDACVILMPR